MKAAKTDSLTGRVVCVADTGHEFRTQVERWFVCLTRLAGVPAGQLLTVFVGVKSVPDWAAPLCEAGMKAEVASTFDPRSPHCNKIAGLHCALSGATGPIVLSDCDVAFIRDPRRFPRRDDAISAKPVDRSNPPTRVLDAILRTAGLPTPPKVRFGTRPWNRTYLGNANGGVLVFGEHIVPTLAERWARRAEWLLDRSSLLEAWAVHVDQVSLLLAILDEQVEVVLLHAAHNFPTHLKGGLFLSKPVALHYHKKVDGDGMLLPTGRRIVDLQIARVNRTLLAARAGAG